MGVEWFGMVMGLGFVLSFGYWCTDFLVVQRAMAADSMTAARRTPLIAAFPKMLFPFLVILPGHDRARVAAPSTRPAGGAPATDRRRRVTAGAPRRCRMRRPHPVQGRRHTANSMRDTDGRPQLDYDLAIPRDAAPLLPDRHAGPRPDAR